MPYMAPDGLLKTASGGIKNLRCCRDGGPGLVRRLLMLVLWRWGAMGPTDCQALSALCRASSRVVVISCCQGEEFMCQYAVFR